MKKHALIKMPKVTVSVIFEAHQMRWLSDGSFLYKENGKLFWRSLNFTSHRMPTLDVHYAKGVFYYVFPGGIMEYIPATEIYRVVACGKLELQGITYIGDIVLLLCSDRILTISGVKVPIFDHTIHEYNSKYLITYTCEGVQYQFNVFTLPDFELIHTRNLQKNGTKPNDEAILKQRFKIINDEIIQLGGQFIRISETSETEETEEIEKTTETKVRRTGGRKCSVNGSKYENIVYDVVSKCTIGGKPFCTTPELGGNSAKNDIMCNYRDIKIGIEVKTFNTPDYMQCRIIYCDGVWQGTKNSKIPDGSRRIFNELLSNLVLFNKQKPPFIDTEITHEEWLSIKSKSDTWNDTYIDIPDDTIRKLYKEKGCYYVQLNNGYGLYHLGDDVCGFGVPIFDLPQRLRVRIKVHFKCTSRGYCNLSVTASCQPKNIRTMPKSPYTLDGYGVLPKVFNTI